MPDGNRERIIMNRILEWGSDTIDNLKLSIGVTIDFRRALTQKLDLSLDTRENSSIQNFTLGIIDGLMEFPMIAELYNKNPDFREIFWLTIKQIGISDFVRSLLEIKNDIVEGDAYSRWKSWVKWILLLTGIWGVLRQFWWVVIKSGPWVTMKKVAMSATLTATHGVAYSWNSNIKESLGANIEAQLAFH